MKDTVAMFLYFCFMKQFSFLILLSNPNLKQEHQPKHDTNLESYDEWSQKQLQLLKEKGTIDKGTGIADWKIYKHTSTYSKLRMDGKPVVFDHDPCFDLTIKYAHPKIMQN